MWCAAALVLIDMNMRRKKSWNWKQGFALHKTDRCDSENWTVSPSVLFCCTFSILKFQWKGRKTCCLKQMPEICYWADDRVFRVATVFWQLYICFFFFAKGNKSTPQCYIGLIHSQWLEWMNLMLVNKFSLFIMSFGRTNTPDVASFRHRITNVIYSFIP